MTDVWTKTSNTPTPWKVFRATNGLLLGIGKADTAEGITDARGGLWGDGNEALANAEHIVLCVNSHAALVKALERAKTYVELTCDEEAGEEAAAARDDLATIDAALSAARAPATER